MSLWSHGLRDKPTPPSAYTMSDFETLEPFFIEETGYRTGRYQLIAEVKLVDPKFDPKWVMVVIMPLSRSYIIDLKSKSKIGQTVYVCHPDRLLSTFLDKPNIWVKGPQVYLHGRDRILELWNRHTNQPE